MPRDMLDILPDITNRMDVSSIKEELVEMVAPNIPKALKILLSVDRLHIVMAIYNKNGPMSYKELRNELNEYVSDSALNHGLTELKDGRLVILDHGEYYLTGLASAVIGAFVYAKKEIYKNPEKLFMPVIVNSEIDIGDTVSEVG